MKQVVIFGAGDQGRVGLESVVFQPFTRLGNNVFIGSGTVIGHDATVGDHCFLSCGVTIAGAVDTGPYTFIGASATISNGITTGAKNIIGGGAIILKDTPDGGVYLTQGTEAAPTTSAVLSPYLGARRRRLDTQK